MKTQIWTVKNMPQIINNLLNGEVVAFPTETVYGLGANALNEHAVKKVYTVKGRPSDNPLIVHVSDLTMLKRYVPVIDKKIQQLIEHFWPGPLTLIFKVETNIFPKVVTGGLNTVAFRVPKNQITLQMIQQANIPIVGPSANTSGKPSPTSAQHVFHDLNGKISGILNDGSTQIGIESTVLDVSNPDGPPVILRPGAVTKEDLEELIGNVTFDQHLLGKTEVPKAPGMKYKHYAPDVPVWIVDGYIEEFKHAIAEAKQQKKQIGLYVDYQLAMHFDQEAAEVFTFGDDSVEQATKNLFAGLRSLDKQSLDVIFAQSFPEKGLGVAYMNRLKKAANQNIVKKK